MEENEEKFQKNAFKLFILLGAQYIFFVLLNYCLYPPDEPPKMRMLKLENDVSRSHLTGETVRPITRLSVAEIALLTRHNHVSPCRERSFQLTEEDQMLMLLLKDGEVNQLKDRRQLFADMTLDYGSLIMKRSSADFEFAKSVRELIEPPAETGFVVEALTPLKRTKELQKEKKKRNKERKDALNQLTGGEGGNKIFTRIMPERTGISRKKSKMSTMEDGGDKTLQRKKLRPTKGFRNLVVNEMVSSEDNMKKRKSTMLQSTPSEHTPSGVPFSCEKTKKSAH